MNTRPATGLVLGKFMPPHAGHLFLCDFARAASDHLTILVCSLPGDEMPGDRRTAWMRELYPECRVVWCDETVPQEPAEHPDFWAIWRDLIARYVGPVEAVFASEAYGQRLAVELSARFIPCDPLREAVPISATAIRADPFACWPFIPRPVRPWFVRRVCVFGPESSGKTTLGRALAAALDAGFLPEYGRTWTDVFGVEINAEALAEIAAGHVAARSAAMRVADRILVEDTDPILTCVWADMLLGERQQWMAGALDPADLYLLTDIDFDWIDDGTRYFPDPESRRRFDVRCEAELVDRGLPYVRVSGSPDARLDQALRAVRSAFIPDP